MSEGMPRVTDRRQLAELAATLGLDGWGDWDEADGHGVAVTVDEGGADVGTGFPDDDREARLSFWKDGEWAGTVNIADLLTWAAEAGNG